MAPTELAEPLSVTPSVGSGDMVTMSINQAVTDVGEVELQNALRALRAARRP